MLFDFAPTPYDVNFKVFGFPTRIHPLFWALAFLLSLRWADGLPPQLKMGAMLIGVGCVFISILVHELGHAFMIRRAGSGPEIVLHAMGGHAAYHIRQRISPRMNMVISFAGPAAGFCLYGLVVGLQFLLDNSQWHVPILLRFALLILEVINLYWSLFNLLPVYPLDGGHIVRTWMVSRWGTRGLLNSLSVSIAACIGMIFWSYMRDGQSFLSTGVLFFVMFAFQNVQEYQFNAGSRRW